MPRKKDPEIYTYKKKNGETWYGFKTYLGIDKESGKSKKITRQGFRTRKEAEKAKTKLKADGASLMARRQDIASNRKTVQEVYDIWLPIYSANVKGSTYVQTGVAWDHLKPEFGDDYIDSINVDHLQKFADDLAQNFISYKYILNLLHRLIKYAIMRDLCEKDPFDKIIIPKKSAKKSTRVKNNLYTLDELKLFLHCASMYHYSYYAFFMVLGSLGLRRGEAVGLKWKDIDEDNKTIHIARTVSRDKNNSKQITSTKTTSSDRVLLIPTNLMEVLTKYKERSFYTKPDDFMFPKSDGSFYAANVANYWQSMMYKKFPQLRKITAHGFRHTLATLLYDGSDTIKPKDVQALLGHARVTTALDIYTHVTDKRKANIAKSVNNLDI